MPDQVPTWCATEIRKPKQNRHFGVDRQNPRENHHFFGFSPRDTALSWACGVGKSDRQVLHERLAAKPVPCRRVQARLLLAHHSHREGTYFGRASEGKPRGHPLLFVICFFFFFNVFGCFGWGGPQKNTTHLFFVCLFAFL